MIESLQPLRGGLEVCVSGFCFRYFACGKELSLDRFAKLNCQPFFGKAKKLKWWVEEDLNLRPHAYQACALTT